MNREAGKGDKRRPYDTEAWDNNYDAIFRKRKTVQEIAQDVKKQHEANKSTLLDDALDSLFKAK